MTLTDYYQILGIPLNSSPDDIKRAYRQKARMYHPDINPSPDAKDKFILATEAYEFLIANSDKMTNDEEAYRQAMEEWRKYRQDRSQQRARAYARASYVHFRNTKFYKTTRIFDGTSIVFSLLVSVMVVIFSIIGYTYRVKNPIPGIEKPSVFGFIMLLALGMTFFVVSLIYLKAYLESSKKHRKKT
jgi:hypothetical protein